MKPKTKLYRTLPVAVRGLGGSAAIILHFDPYTGNLDIRPLMSKTKNLSALVNSAIFKTFDAELDPDISKYDVLDRMSSSKNLQVNSYSTSNRGPIVCNIGMRKLLAGWLASQLNASYVRDVADNPLLDDLDTVARQWFAGEFTPGFTVRNSNAAKLSIRVYKTVDKTIGSFKSIKFVKKEEPVAKVIQAKKLAWTKPADGKVVSFANISTTQVDEIANRVVNTLLPRLADLMSLQRSNPTTTVKTPEDMVIQADNAQGQEIKVKGTACVTENPSLQLLDTAEPARILAPSILGTIPG